MIHTIEVGLDRIYTSEDGIIFGGQPFPTDDLEQILKNCREDVRIFKTDAPNGFCGCGTRSVEIQPSELRRMNRELLEQNEGVSSITR